MLRRCSPLQIACTAIVSLIALSSAGCGSGRSTASGPASGGDSYVEQARAAARRFLSDFVTRDGRVLRHDQGDDIVSEGQSYALVLAQVAADDALFDRVWQWTADHLRRDDGLLSSHARADGSIIDANSATDADLVTAWALLRATGPNADAHHRDGRQLADAVMAHETVTLPDEGMLLVAGNWASDAPATLNPSYWALPALTSIARLTGDGRWDSVEAASVRSLRGQTDNGRRLPPDWSRVDGGTVTPMPDPNGQAPEVRYSLDAQRVVIWAATGGDDASRLAATWSTLLGDDQHCRSIALRPDGSVLDGRGHPLGLVAAAAAAGATGSMDARDHLLAEAGALDATQPTYYGRAWVALGRTLLTTQLLT